MFLLIVLLAVAAIMIGAMYGIVIGLMVLILLAWLLYTLLRPVVIFAYAVVVSMPHICRSAYKEFVKKEPCR